MTDRELARYEAWMAAPASHGMDAIAAEAFRELIKYVRLLENNNARLKALCDSHEEYIEGSERDAF